MGRSQADSMIIAGHVSVWLLACWLAVQGLVLFGYGAWRAWALDGDGDTLTRFVEYTGFRAGAYPNHCVDAQLEGLEYHYCVYPPYALPMFAVFFEPGGLLQGRILIEVLSFVALVLMGAFGNAMLRRHGAAWGAVGAFAAAAISGNKTVLNNGQFSLICMGFILLQIILLQRGRSLTAGLCWAGAMLKPQIGLAFGAMFLIQGWWRGLVFGLVLLTVLSLVASWWTDVAPARLVEHWLFEMQMRFAAESTNFGPAAVAELLGLDYSILQYAAFVTLGCLMLSVALVVSRTVGKEQLLPFAGIGAALGRVLLYHHVYDDIMVFPLLIECLRLALDRRDALGIASATSVALTLWVPHPILRMVPGCGVLQPLIWIVAAVYVGLVTLSRQGAQ